MKQIPSERSYKLHAVFLQLSPTELFDEKKKNSALIFLQYSRSVGSTQPLTGMKPRWMNHACGHHMTQMLFGNQGIFEVHVSYSCRTAHPVYPNAPQKGTAFGDGITASLKIRE